MADDLPIPTGENPLPSVRDWIASWLGFQLPNIPMPQIVKNFDKAIGKILLAAGENAEARIKVNTGKAKAKGKIAIEGLYRTEEEKRKIENRASIVKVAVDEMNNSTADKIATDAKSEIDDDWLNHFARIAEDKSSEQLQILFGRILAGEIKRPGSFAIRTIQLMATMSKADAEMVSQFLSFAIGYKLVPFRADTNLVPAPGMRLVMEELGIAGHPTEMGGLVLNVNTIPKSYQILVGSGYGILISNDSDSEMRLRLPGQPLTIRSRATSNCKFSAHAA